MLGQYPAHLILHHVNVIVNISFYKNGTL